MKKYIGLIIFVLIACIAMSVSAKAMSEDMMILEALDIGDFENNDAYVTRGQFVSAVSDIMNYYQRPAPKDGAFSDVTVDSKYSGGIYYALGIKLISGYSGTSFGINDNIAYEDAVKILVSALGYDYLAGQKGGYPLGYITVAMQNDMLDGVDSKLGDKLTCEKAASLIVNAMNTPALRQVAYGDSEAYEATENHSFLYQYAKISLVKGIVTDDGISSLWAASSKGEGRTSIAGYTYNSKTIDTSSFLGYYVNAYVSYEASNKDSILYISKGDIGSVLEIPADKLMYGSSGFSLSNIIFENSYGREDRARLTDNADYIFNGVAYADMRISDLDIKSGKIVLIDNTGDGIYDVVHVDAREVFAVSGTSLDNKIIYYKNNGRVELDTADKLIIYRDGLRAELGDIEQWDIVSASISKNEKVKIIHVSTQRLKGIVESIDEAVGTISVNGKLYSVIDAAIISEIKLGCEYEFCLDTNMNIAAVKDSVVDSTFVGIAIALDKGQGLDSANKLKIYNAKGDFVIYNFDKKTKINGKSYANDDAVYNEISGKLLNNLISYRIGSNGRLTAIYTADSSIGSDADSLKLEFTTSTNLTYSSSADSLGGKVILNSSTLIFALPSDRTRFEAYAVMDPSSLVHNRGYVFSAYSYGMEDGVSDYLILTVSDTYDTFVEPFLVERISKSTNADGEAVECVYGFNRYGEVKLLSNSSNLFSAKGVGAGDIIRCITDSKKAAKDVQMIYDYKGTGLNTSAQGANGGVLSSGRLAILNVYARYGNIIECTLNKGDEPFSETKLSEGLDKYAISSSNIYSVEDSRGIVVSKASVHDILDYKNASGDYSQIFMYSQSGVDRMIVIYK